MYQLPGALAPMANLRQFIVCRLVAHPTKSGKFNKFPVNFATGDVWNAHDPAIWLDVATATAMCEWFGPGHGVGFVFTEGCGFSFIDIDNCANPDGTWSELARHIVAAFPGAAVEISQSGRGLHIFCAGTVPEHSSRNDALGLEFYHAGRFVYLGTGAVGNAGTDCTVGLQWLTQHFFPPRAAATSDADWSDEAVPQWSGPTDDDELIARALGSRQSAASTFGGRASFRDLWEGNADALGRSFPDSGGRAYDASAADAALASHLAFFTGNNHARIERLMLRSALRRGKWDRVDYLRGTITYSCNRTDKWLRDTSVATAAAPGSEPLSFAAAAAGAIPATVVNVQNALQSAESQYLLRLDTFRQRIVMQDRKSAQQIDLSDTHYVRLRSSLELAGFKPVSKDMIRDCVAVVSEANQYDSGIEWGNSLVWDGVPRVERAMIDYFGCVDTPYARAVGKYMFTALAGRLMDPGCQADMSVILVDKKQGTGKTSSVKALSPFKAAFGEVDLGKIDHDDVARKLRGKLVVELGELRGLASKEDESIKAFISRTEEEWVEKYETQPRKMERRCLFIGTSNREDLLTDPTGNRRWLPVHTGKLRPGAITEDCHQLWAEGIAMWRQHGILWEQAQELAEYEHSKFARDSSDPWEAAVRGWLDAVPPPLPGEIPSPITRGEAGVGVLDILTGPLRMSIDKCTKREEMRVANVLRALGYEKQHTREGKVWLRAQT